LLAASILLEFDVLSTLCLHSVATLPASGCLPSPSLPILYVETLPSPYLPILLLVETSEGAIVDEFGIPELTPANVRMAR
jgi:hypothetical protein